MKEHKSAMGIANFSLPSNSSDEDKFNGHFFEFQRYIQNEVNYMTAISVTAIIICTTLFGNAAILITIWKTSSLHSVANILLSSLAVSDFAVGLVVQPLFIASLRRRTYLAFILYVIFGSFFIIASFLNVTAIGIERLLALQLHLRYNAVVTSFRATLVIIFIWLFSGIVSSFSLWIPKVFYIAPSILYISVLAGNFVVYLKIYLIIRRHQRQIQHQQQQQQHNIFSDVKRFKRTALKTFFACIVLICCYMPYSLVVKIAVIEGLKFSTRVYFITVALIFLNSTINPLLYYWRDKEIRTALKQLFCC